MWGSNLLYIFSFFSVSFLIFTCFSIFSFLYIYSWFLLVFYICICNHLYNYWKSCKRKEYKVVYLIKFQIDMLLILLILNGCLLSLGLKCWGFVHLFINKREDMGRRNNLLCFKRWQEVTKIVNKLLKLSTLVMKVGITLYISFLYCILTFFFSISLFLFWTFHCFFLLFLSVLVCIGFYYCNYNF